MAQLRRRQEELDARGVHMVLITFGSPELIRLWLAEEGFGAGGESVPGWTIALDQERAGYAAYGLERSLRRAFGLRTLLAYAGLLSKGRKIYRGRGDAAQLGGDFIVNARGRLVLAHPSREPADRPVVAMCLKRVRREERE